MTKKQVSTEGKGTLNPLVGLCVAQAYSDGALNSLRLMLGALKDPALYRSVRRIKNRLHDVCLRIEKAIEKANKELEGKNS